jgi:hypothetical protein
MKQARVVMLSMLMVLLCSLFGQAQQNVATAANATVPPLIPFSSVATDEGGSSLSGVVSITFSLYSGQQGGEPLWMETQNNIQLDSTGHYSVQLGITKPAGVPTTLFTTGEARWLGVQIAEQAQQPRVLLLSVPYALKAGDAATVGGLPPSAFVLAAPGTASAASAPTTFTPSTASSADAPAGTDVTGSGTADFIPLWTTTSNIADSVLFQSGSGNTAKIGIGTTAPATTLDVKGGGTIRGTLSLPTAGMATATKGFNSQSQTLAASAFSSATSTPVNQTFQWQAEPAGNDTSTPSGTLNLLFGEGTAKPSETGLHIANNGQITFATGQAFPGTGDGTVTGVTAGTDLTGGGSSGSVTLNVDTTKIPQLAAANTFTANQTVNGNVTATSFTGSGTGLTNVTAANSNELGGMAPGAYAQLAAANTFTTSQTVNGSVTATSFTGSGTGLTNVTSTNSNELGGLAPGAFAQLAANNTFSGTQTVNNTVSMTGTNTLGVLQVTNTATTGNAPAIVGTTDSTNASGVKGFASATTGGVNGVFGTTSSTGGYGVQGTSPNVGVYGQADGASGNTTRGFVVGVWGDTGGAGEGDGIAVLGTVNDSVAGYFYNNSNGNVGWPALYAENDGTYNGSPAFAFYAGGVAGIDHCTIDTGGNLACTGTISGGPTVEGGARRVALYSVQSPENWFEDAGSGQLSNGSARIDLDPTFAQTVNAGVEYHVFLTPKGDSEGLYVSNETPQGFEVHEQRGGHSSIAFDYRIMAKRVGYENVRLADLTEQFNKQEAQHKRMRRPVRASAAPQASPVLPQPPLRAVAQPLAAQHK